MIGSALTITRPRRNMYKVKYECACTHFRKTAGTIRSLIYSALTVLITSLQHEKVWIVTCERAHAHCRQGASNIHSHDPFTCDTHTHQWVVCTTHLHVNESCARLIYMWMAVHISHMNAFVSLTCQSQELTRDVSTPYIHVHMSTSQSTCQHHMSTSACDSHMQTSLGRAIEKPQELQRNATFTYITCECRRTHYWEPTGDIDSYTKRWLSRTHTRNVSRRCIHISSCEHQRTH